MYYNIKIIWVSGNLIFKISRESMTPETPPPTPQEARASGDRLPVSSLDRTLLQKNLPTGL